MHGLLVDFLPSIVAWKQTGGKGALVRRPVDAQGADRMDCDLLNSIVLAPSIPFHEMARS